MRKIIIGLLALVSISAFADNSFQLKITSNVESQIDVHSYMGNMYARDLTGIVNGKEQLVILVCMVDPVLSDGYKNKLLPGALEECGIAIDGGVHLFDENIDIHQLLKEIDSSKGLQRTVTLKNSIDFRVW